MKKIISVILSVFLLSSCFSVLSVSAAETKTISGSSSTKIEFENYSDKTVSVAGASGNKVISLSSATEVSEITVPVTFEKSGRYNIRYASTKKSSSLSEISFSLDLKSSFPVPGSNADTNAKKLSYSGENGQDFYLFEEKSIWVDANTYDLKTKIQAVNGKYSYAIDYIEFYPTPVPQISSTEKTRIELDEYAKAGIYDWDRGVKADAKASGGKLVSTGGQTLDPDFSFDVKVEKSGLYDIDAALGEKMGKSYLSAVRVKLDDQFEINNTEKAVKSLGYGWDSMPVAIYSLKNVHIEKGNYKLSVIIDLVTNQEVTHKYVYDYIDVIPVSIPDEKEDDTESSGVTYSVRFNSNGAGIVPAQTVAQGKTVSKPSDPQKSGYEFGGWFTDNGFKNEYDFESKVTKNITLYAKWNIAVVNPEPIPWKNPFTDIRENDWYYKSVEYAHNNGLMNGVSESLFGPNSEVTRAMFVTVLYRIENQPKASASKFTDVDAGSYFEKAVAWGFENNIVNGVSDTEFAPHNRITREQMAAMMYRYAKYKGIDTSVGENTNILSYEDFDTISEYAISAIQWVCGAGIMNGETESTFNPKNISTRAQAATVFMRVIEASK